MKIHKYNLIYKTTNLVNGKIYTGQHRTDNLNDKYIGSGRELREAIKEFGKENFYCETLEFCLREELSDKEKYWVKFYDANNPLIGYNKTAGGGGCIGYIPTEETILKLSISHIQFYENNPEFLIAHSERRRQFLKDNPEFSKENGIKIAQHYIDNPEARIKVSEKSKEKCKDPEHIKKKSEVTKKKFEDPEFKEKHKRGINEFFKNNPEELIKRGKKRSQFFKDNPEEGKKQGEHRKKLFKENPEIQKKATEKRKKFYEDNPELLELKIQRQKEAALLYPVFTCEICDKKIKGKGNYNRHTEYCLRKSKEVRIYKTKTKVCEFCNGIFSCSNFDRHQKLCRSNPNYQPYSK